MEKRAFGNTGMMVSVLTFGAWSIGGAADMGGVQIGWPGVEDGESVDAMEAAFDAGVNVFDTADSYGKGHSEELVGKTFKGRRDRVVISSKGGMVDDPSGLKLDFSAKHLVEACEASLKRLQTDYLDVYFMHLILDKHPLTEESRGALEGLKQAGKVRHFGVSVNFPHQGMEMLEKGFGEAMMIEYSPLKRMGVVEVLEAARKAGVGVIMRGALEKGMLSGKYSAGHRFAANDVRTRIPTAYVDRVLGNVARLKGRAVAEGWSLLGMALAFQLAQPGCSTITVGLKTRQQVEENVAALGETKRFDWEKIVRELEAGGTT